VLAGQLPLPIPVLLGKGTPGCGFPRPWSVHQWIDGDPLVRYEEPVADMPQFACDLADFLAALYRIDATGGPGPGQHNFFRGGPLAIYDGQTQRALAALGRHIDTDLAAEVWRAAPAAGWHGPAVWFHGDAQPGNLLLDHGRLSAVLDFGTSGVGDPSCDTTIAWTFLSGESTGVFKDRLPVDSATWVRGCGWAIWRAMMVLVSALESGEREGAAYKTRVIEKIRSGCCLAYALLSTGAGEHADRRPARLVAATVSAHDPAIGVVKLYLISWVCTLQGGRICFNVRITDFCAQNTLRTSWRRFRVCECAAVAS
jgi:aminoglycoside phosphotransferase (APT) family kinase protein